MSWETIGTIYPGGEWEYFVTPLSSRLLMFSYLGDRDWLKKHQPRLYLRLRFSADTTFARWTTLYPKHNESEVLIVEPIPIEPNFLDMRKRRSFESLNANYSVIVQEYRANPYLINYL